MCNDWWLLRTAAVKVCRKFVKKKAQVFRGFTDTMSHASYFWLLEDTMLASKGIWIKHKKSSAAIRRIEGSDCLYVDFSLNIAPVTPPLKIVIDEYNKSTP